MTTPYVNPRGNVAGRGKLRLSNQLEGLGRDTNVKRLNLSVDGRTAGSIVARVTGGTITRTTQGASTLQVIVDDHDRSLIRSGLFGDTLTISNDYNRTALGQQLSFFEPIDTELDGLFFRLVAFQRDQTTGDTLTLTFEDREVALLRSYPKAGDPNEYLVLHPNPTRIEFMRFLIGQVVETVQPIRIVSPMLPGQGPITSNAQQPNAVARAVGHAAGFPANGASTVTVKGAPASRAQLAGLTQVLDVGMSMGATRKQLVCAVMVVTQESDAGADTNSGGRYVGWFQQDSTFGSSWRNLGGGTGWDISADAHAFFTVLQQQDAANPGVDYATLCEDVQHSGQGTLYGNHRTEAEHTVDTFLGVSPSAPGGPTVYTPAGTDTITSTGFFYRGQNKVIGNKSIVVRENNWACLQRLAAEVGWLCYCVSGTIYIEPADQVLVGKQVAYQFSETDDAIHVIGFQIDTGKSDAKATVIADAARWAAPPGTVCSVSNCGPADGRWFVQTIQRDLFQEQATITLGKPQPTLADAESADPIQATQQQLKNSGAGANSSTAPVPVTSSVSRMRTAIVDAAQRAVADQQARHAYIYLQQRPMPVSLFGPAPRLMDCSAFVTLVYKAAGAPDPNGNGYNGSGNTATLYTAGVRTTDPQPGDLAFFGTDPALGPAAPGHVAVYIGDGNVISMGKQGDPSIVPVADWTDFDGYCSYPLYHT